MKGRKCRMPSGDFSAGEAKGVGLNFKTSPDLSVHDADVYRPVTRWWRSLHQHRAKPWGDASTPVPRNHLSAIFQGEGSVDSGSGAFWNQREGKGTLTGRLEVYQHLHGKVLVSVEMARGSSDDRHLISGRLITLTKPQTLAGGLDRWQNISCYGSVCASMIPEARARSQRQSCESEAQRAMPIATDGWCEPG